MVDKAIHTYALKASDAIFFPFDLQMESFVCSFLVHDFAHSYEQTLTDCGRELICN